ncbi:hypothetical protein [Tardibacter chloracetimidivorans]|uniref:hypothetical protein n=1 Tax=Tardibacter chloracetimidivorans TaxID=1921510 RepID=UPI0013010CD5|nr:hypothetical protein [Tardibacter chloracetimidivorans]
MMLNKLLNWFRRPKWEEFSSRVDRTYYWPRETLEPQWRTNFSLTAAQRSERSRKAAATRKANKARAQGA